MAPSLVGISSVTGVASRAVAWRRRWRSVLGYFVPKVAVIFLLVPPQVAGSLLVFTSCFMIAGGMDIMLSRQGGARDLHRAFHRQSPRRTVYPAYFSHFSPAVRGFIGNPLSFGLAAAIGLSLLFRIGTRQYETMKWSSAPGGADAAILVYAQNGNSSRPARARSSGGVEARWKGCSMSEGPDRGVTFGCRRTARISGRR